LVKTPSSQRSALRLVTVWLQTHSLAIHQPMVLQLLRLTNIIEFFGSIISSLNSNIKKGEGIQPSPIKLDQDLFPGPFF